MRKWSLLAVSVLLAGSLAASAQQYAISGRIALAGDGGWDYLLADSVNGQLYVSHGTEVDIVDLASEKPVGKIGGMKRTHGIAIANDLHRGYISDGGDDAIVIFDLKSHAVVQKVPAGQNPDGILYDPHSKRVFAFNGGSNDVTARRGCNREPQRLKSHRCWRMAARVNAGPSHGRRPAEPAAKPPACETPSALSG